MNGESSKTGTNVDAVVVSSANQARSNDSTQPAPSKHDLHGTRSLNRVDVPGLHTLATVVLDYMGRRIVAQSIIPGVLQGENNSKLVYGSIDGGRTIASDPDMHALMRQAANKMYVAERLVTPLGAGADGADGVAPAHDGAEPRALKTCAGTAPVVLSGPVDCKGMEGCDGRKYILDLVNMFPGDSNFTKDAEDGLCKIGDRQSI